ncbi:MAG TPA: conjugal transfer protein MobC [Puia sp.]
MSNGTGENEMGLQKILEFLRAGSILILLLHFYFYSYPVFLNRKLVSAISDRLIIQIGNTGLLTGTQAKNFSLGLLLVSLIGSKGRKDEKIKKQIVILCFGLGLFIYFISDIVFPFPVWSTIQTVAYVMLMSTGYILILTGGSQLSRLIRIQLGHDIFNEINESFPQEERLLQNEFSINLPTCYLLKGKPRQGWINIINPFRGLLVVGSPGSGKSYFVIQHVIRQHITKGFTMLIYDFKYPDLSEIAFHTLSAQHKAFSVKPSFFQINFDDPGSSNRCNPLDPDLMFDITDASESSRSILLGLNREWITKQGDFFVESPINFVTAIIWFLKKYKNGIYCTLPHVIELMQADYEELFPVLKSEPEIEVLINPFISAYQNDAMEQLEGQIASAKIGMARLSSPQLYWVLSGSDFTLDINNPESPKILCLANNPQKQQTFGPVLSLYVTRLVKLVNQKDKLKCSLVFDEFPTLFFNGIDSLIATARSNQVATCLGMQDFSQLKKDYGNDQAAVIMNIAGNIISGQVMGETSKLLAERFGKITQIKESISINRSDVSVSKSGQMDFAIPQSKIASLSSGEFVGMVADNPDQKIKLKSFHCEIVNRQQANSKDLGGLLNLPGKSTKGTEGINDNYTKIKTEVQNLVESELEKLLKGIKK